MEIGIIGLGKMGSRMAKKLLMEGHDVVVWNRSKEAIEELQVKIQNSKGKISMPRLNRDPEWKLPSGQKLKVARSVEDLVNSLQKPRIVWLMLPSGSATNDMMAEIIKYTEQDDIVINGANGHFKDAQKQAAMFKEKGVRFLDIGVSGGVIAAENGYPFMVGGDKSAYQYISPLLDSLAKPNGGHAYFGEAGAGHFVKMVHNGIEYGMMQAIGEGFGVLEKAPYPLDLLAVSQLWQKGTIISSFLIDRATDALKKDPILANLDGVIDATGEASWTVEQAAEQKVPVENIQQSLDFRRRSQSDKTISDSFAARMVAALRREFGGHKVKEK